MPGGRKGDGGEIDQDGAGHRREHEEHGREAAAALQRHDGERRDECADAEEHVEQVQRRGTVPGIEVGQQAVRAGDERAAAGADDEGQGDQRRIAARELQEHERDGDERDRCAQHHFLPKTVQQHARREARDHHAARQRDEHAARSGQRQSGALAQRRQNAAEQRRDRSPDENAEEARPHEPKRAGVEALRRKRVIRSEPHGSSTSQRMATMAVFPQAAPVCARRWSLSSVALTPAKRFARFMPLCYTASIEFGQHLRRREACARLGLDGVRGRQRHDLRQPGAAVARPRGD